MPTKIEIEMLDPTGVSEADVIQLVGGVWQAQDLSVNGVPFVAGDSTLDLDDIPNGSVRQLYTESDAEDAGKKTYTAATMPASPSNGQRVYVSDAGGWYTYDLARLHWFSDLTRTAVLQRGVTYSAVSTNNILVNTGVTFGYFVGDWTIVGYTFGNQDDLYEGEVRVETTAGAALLTVTIADADNGFKEDLTVDADVTVAAVRGRIDVAVSTANNAELIMYIKKRI
jgi:hypothetical protein